MKRKILCAGLNHMKQLSGYGAMNDMTDVRAAEQREIDHLARLWYAGWQDAHAQIVPAELRRLRSLDSFKQRLQAALRDTRVVVPFGSPFGFCITKENELYQYMSRRRREARA